MRISREELLSLRASLQGEPYDRAFVFGSRVDDRRRGGDIDLLLYSSASPFNLAHRIASRYARLMDARLDVVVIDPDHATDEQRAFLATISPQPLDAVA